MPRQSEWAKLEAVKPYEFYPYCVGWSSRGGGRLVLYRRYKRKADLLQAIGKYNTSVKVYEFDFTEEEWIEIKEEDFNAWLVRP